MLTNELHSGGVRALYDYDNTIFDDFTLPEIFSTPNKFFEEYPYLSVITAEDIINDIIFRHGDTPLFHPEPTLFKFQLKAWCNRRKYIWARWYNDIVLDYDPIYNYNRLETIRHKDKTDIDGNISVKNGGNDTIHNEISAENVETWANDTKSITEYNSNRNTTDNTKSNGTHDEDNWIRGNIGVTTTAQMMEQDMNMLKKFDLVRIISDEFCEEFCLGVW